jgi:hypothetical protein
MRVTQRLANMRSKGEGWIIGRLGRKERGCVPLRPMNVKMRRQVRLRERRYDEDQE